jgi:hypothetical protein
LTFSVPIILLIVVGLLSVAGKVSAADPVTGAVWTTDPHGERVNGNLYTDAKDVYVAGGPHKQGAAGLPDGIYYFQVTDPPGKTLLSSDALWKRRFEVQGGEIVSIDGGAHKWNPDTTRGFGIVVQLWPFKFTPNKGGVYKVWVTRVDNYREGAGSFGFVPSLSKTDNFKVKLQEVSKYFELWVTQGISGLRDVAFYVNYTVAANGSPLLPWTTGQLTYDRTEGIYDVFRYETSFPLCTCIFWKFIISNTFTWVSDTHGPELINTAGMVNKETPPSPPKTFALTIKPPLDGANYFANYTYYDELNNPIGSSHIVPLTERSDDTFSATVNISGIIKWQFYIEKPLGTEVWRSQTFGPETIPPGTTPRINPFYLSSISGYKFEDHDGDSVRDGEDQGLSDWNISLFKDSPSGAPIASILTGADGYFRFDFLVAGTYYVNEEVKGGWVRTTSPAIYGPITISPGQAVEIKNVNFGNFKTFCISGHKYNDKAGDGPAGINAPVEGWNVTLYKNGAKINENQTGPDGSYSFCGLGPGNYTVAEEVKAGWMNMTAAAQGSFQGFSGQNIQNVDFYNFQLFKVNGHKYSYPDGTGLEGWDITLYKDGEKVAETQTGPDGYYEFTDLAPGDYVVSEMPRTDEGWVPFGPTTYEFAAESGVNQTFDFWNYRMLQITDTSDNRCPLSSFDVVFTPSNTGTNMCKFSSTNPGSFYFNIAKYGTAGTPITIVADLPPDEENAPFDSPNFILQHTYVGSSSTVDVHVYGGRLESPCGFWVPDWSKDITSLFTITTSLDGKSVTVSGNVPSTGLVFVTIHTDYQISGSLTLAQTQLFKNFVYTFNVGSTTFEFPINDVKLPS